MVASKSSQSVVSLNGLFTAASLVRVGLVKLLVTEDKGFGERGGGIQGLPLWFMYPARDGEIAVRENCLRGTASAREGIRKAW